MNAAPSKNIAIPETRRSDQFDFWLVKRASIAYAAAARIKLV